MPQVGKYKLEKTLGSGAFAKVKRGVHVETGEEVAVKIIDRNLVSEKGLMEQITREITVMNTLTHPNIIKLHKIMHSKNKLYIIMELAPTGDLFDIIDHAGAAGLPESAARDYFRQIVSAVSFLHKNDVAHRDVKPENLLVARDGTLKLSDFGLCQYTKSRTKPATTTTSPKEALKDDEVKSEPEEDGGLAGDSGTAPGVREKEKRKTADDPRVSADLKVLLQTSCGTPVYASPELVNAAEANGEGYDGQLVDSWACGVLLYAMCCGELPFEDEMGELYGTDSMPAMRFSRNFPDGAKDIVTKLVVKDPKARATVQSIKDHSWLTVSDGDAKFRREKSKDPQTNIDKLQKKEDVLNNFQTFLKNDHDGSQSTGNVLIKKKAQLASTTFSETPVLTADCDPDAEGRPRGLEPTRSIRKGFFSFGKLSRPPEETSEEPKAAKSRPPILSAVSFKVPTSGKSFTPTAGGKREQSDAKKKEGWTADASFGGGGLSLGRLPKLGSKSQEGQLGNKLVKKLALKKKNPPG